MPSEIALDNLKDDLQEAINVVLHVSTINRVRNALSVADRQALQSVIGVMQQVHTHLQAQDEKETSVTHPPPEVEVRYITGKGRIASAKMASIPPSFQAQHQKERKSKKSKMEEKTSTKPAVSDVSSNCEICGGEGYTCKNPYIACSCLMERGALFLC
jgi:hypothetical protein